MFNARESLNLLTESDALDALIQGAYKHAKAIAPPDPSDVAGAVSRFDEEAAELKEAAQQAQQDLEEQYEARLTQREMKVAAVLTMLQVGSRLI